MRGDGCGDVFMGSRNHSGTSMNPHSRFVRGRGYGARDMRGLAGIRCSRVGRAFFPARSQLRLDTGSEIRSCFGRLGSLTASLHSVPAPTTLPAAEATDLAAVAGSATPERISRGVAIDAGGLVPIPARRGRPRDSERARGLHRPRPAGTTGHPGQLDAGRPDAGTPGRPGDASKAGEARTRASCQK